MPRRYSIFLAAIFAACATTTFTLNLLRHDIKSSPIYAISFLLSYFSLILIDISYLYMIYRNIFTTKRRAFVVLIAPMHFLFAIASSYILIHDVNDAKILTISIALAIYYVAFAHNFKLNRSKTKKDT
jgi:hypothetical protein